MEFEICNFIVFCELLITASAFLPIVTFLNLFKKVALDLKKN